MSNPKFQHRHYAAIADVFADMREALYDTQEAKDNAAQVLDEMEDQFVRMFKVDNYGFKPDRFRKAARRAPDMHGRDRI